MAAGSVNFIGPRFQLSPTGGVTHPHWLDERIGDYAPTDAFL
jgi:hypothetical protein